MKEAMREGTAPDSDSGDKDLVSRARAHEEGAFEALFRKYRDRVYRVVYGWCLDPEAALDLTQDVFLRAFRSIGSFKEESSFYTWLCRIAINRCLDYQREKKKHREVALEESLGEESVGCEGVAPASAVLVEELKRDLREAIDKLSEDARTAFTLRFFEGLSYKEIAEALECSVGTVMSRIFYARQRLREILKGHLQREKR
jgi:RNA polymerase sigma-70 factor (ECF subfamily)